MKKTYIGITAIIVACSAHAGEVTLNSTTTSIVTVHYSVGITGPDLVTPRCVLTKNRKSGLFTMPLYSEVQGANSTVTQTGLGIQVDVHGPTVLEGVLVCSDTADGVKYRYVGPAVTTRHSTKTYGQWWGDVVGTKTEKDGWTEHAQPAPTIHRNVVLEYPDTIELEPNARARALWMTNGNIFAQVDTYSDLGEGIQCEDESGTQGTQFKIGPGRTLYCINKMNNRGTRNGYLTMNVTIM